jgi:hypothetical protein
MAENNAYTEYLYINLTGRELFEAVCMDDSTILKLISAKYVVQLRKAKRRTFVMTATNLNTKGPFVHLVKVKEMTELPMTS